MFDVIEAIDACYAPHPADGAWMDGVLAAVGGLAQGRGCYAIAFTRRAGGGGSFELLAQRGPVDVRPTVAPINALLDDDETYRALYQPQPAVELLSARGLRLPPARARALGEALQGAAAAEVLGVFGGEPDLNGVLIGVVRARPGDRPGPRTLHLLRRLSAHLTSARRLRVAAGGRPPLPDDAATEAVLAPSGRIEHAAGGAAAPAARAALADAARRIEWARGRARRVDPEEAARAWRGLVAGSWTIVDHVERGGRRYLLARRNDPVREAARALTAGERAVVGYAGLGHSNKYIAYLLGVAPSTVAKRLARAEAKIGAPSRRVLMQILGGAAP